MTAPPSRISVSNNDGVLTMTVLERQLSQEEQVNEWRDQMAAEIRRASPSGVVIDMRNVEYMTSVALFPLVATRAAAEELGARIVLCNLSDTVMKVLTVTQLIVESREHAKHLLMAENLDDALKILAS